MKTLRAWFKRLAGLTSNQRREQEFSSELESHLQLHTEENIRSGMSPVEARRTAILKLGGLEPTRQAYRERGTMPSLETVLQDLRFASRQLRRNSGFTVIAVLVLALGIAAATAIFTFVDAALIKPLPYLAPNRLVGVTEQIELLGRANISYPDYLDWKSRNTVFTSLDVFANYGYLLSTPAGPETVKGVLVSNGFFRTLGISPTLGRDFAPGDDVPNGPKLVLITYDAWQHRFAGRADIIGHAIPLSGVPYTVIGVLPRQFQFALSGRAEFWAPMQPTSGCLIRRSCHSLEGIARLKDGVSVPTAFAQMQGIAAQLEKQYPDSNRGQGASVLPLAQVIVGDIRPILLTLLAGAALLLAIACVNVASLLLVRSEGRRREFAVRGALGASRLRLVRQFVTESALLVGLAAALGLVASYSAIHLLLRLIPANMLANMAYLQGLGLHRNALLFVAAVSFCSLVLFSLTPVMRLPTAALRAGLADGGRGSAGVAWRRLGSHFVKLELTIAVILLVGAGLLGKSFYRLLHVDLNFQPDHLATLDIVLPDLTYAKDPQVDAVTRRILDRVSALPGVQSASVTDLLPVTTNGNTDWIRFVGRPYDGKHIEVPSRDISEQYFSTLQVKLLRGRFFNPQDTITSPKVAIINSRLAQKYFPGQDPIGQKFGDTTLTPNSIKQIVGVVDDLREGQLDDPIVPAVYGPIAQDPNSEFTLVVRTAQPEASILPTVSAAIRQLDPNIGIVNESTILMHIGDSQTAYLHRSTAWLVAGFAALALLLSTVGLYGVIAYSVSQRGREIGVRMALGAQRASIYRLILGESAQLAAWGIAGGIACSLAAATLLRSMLFGVQAWDVVTLTMVTVILATSALLASYLPARRAASLNPSEALRAE